ncbi:hypothetical protein D3C78_764710 [compost metagenome]
MFRTRSTVYDHFGIGDFQEGSLVKIRSGFLRGLWSLAAADSPAAIFRQARTGSVIEQCCMWSDGLDAWLHRSLLPRKQIVMIEIEFAQQKH